MGNVLFFPHFCEPLSFRAFFSLSIFIFLLPCFQKNSIKARPFFPEQQTRHKYLKNSKI